ncbi:hypothetical protein ES705_27769 [subsurface metagenome]
MVNVVENVLNSQFDLNFYIISRFNMLEQTFLLH